MVAPKFKLETSGIEAAHAYTLITNACAEANRLPAEKQAHDFHARLIYLLPTGARTIGENWLPDDRGDLDGWARLGYFLGALDGRAHAPQRMRGYQSSAAQGVYTWAYSAAYMLAAMCSTRRAAAMEVNRG